MDIPVRKQRPDPVALRRKLNPVDEDVVPDQQRVLHRTRRNLKRLYHECDDEEPGYQDRGQRRKKLNRGLLRLLRHFILFFDNEFFLGHVPMPSIFLSLIAAETTRLTTVEWSVRAGAQSVYQPERPIPSRDLKQVGKCIREMLQTAAERRFNLMVKILHRPINDQRTPNDILLRHKAPIPAVLAVVPVVAHHKVMSLRYDELAVFDQLSHLQPPLAV